MSGDPFSILGVGDDAGDAEIKRAYLALVRMHSPEREPERFEIIRAAYEAIADERRRLERRWFKPGGMALHRLKQRLLATSSDTDDPTSQPETSGKRPMISPKSTSLDALLVHCAQRYAAQRTQPD